MTSPNDLLRRVSALGFPLLPTEESLDANLVLVDMVKARELRLWEGFPVVLANSAEKGLFDHEKAKTYLKRPLDKNCFMELVALSLACYEVLGLKFSWTEQLLETFSGSDKKKFEEYQQDLKKGKSLKVGAHEMSGERLKAMFKNYFTQSQSNLSDLLSVKEELGLEYALSKVFSPKQKELFLKKLQNEKLTKTEKEYFSRTVKKKVMALANTELSRAAKKLLE